jgi:hypothetical protein
MVAALLGLQRASREPFSEQVACHDGRRFRASALDNRCGAALPEIVEHGVSGLLVPAGDEAQLVRAIGAALDLDRARVRESGRARLLLDGCIDRYELTLQSLAG